jgi:hypothetical protein
MKNIVLAFCSLILIATSTTAKTAVYKEEAQVIRCTDITLYGTLLVPADTKSSSLAIIIAGSGPTDRNGNNPYMANDHLKKLAQAIIKEVLVKVKATRLMRLIYASRIM